MCAIVRCRMNHEGKARLAEKKLRKKSVAICHSKYAPGVSANLLLRHAGYCFMLLHSLVLSSQKRMFIVIRVNDTLALVSLSLESWQEFLFLSGKAVATMLHNTNSPRTYSNLSVVKTTCFLLP